MKHLLIILITFILFACRPGSAIQKLSYVDSLLVHDSINKAEKQLAVINENGMSQEELYYLKLLHIQILSRKYEPIPNGIIDSGIVYYEKYNDKAKLSELYYYKGGELYDRGNVSEGIVYFKKAEKLAEGGSLQVKYKIYSSLAFCNFVSENYHISLEYAKKSSKIAIDLRSPDRFLFSKYYESISFDMIGNHDSANICTKQYIPYIKYGTKEEQRVYFAEVCAYYITQNDTVKAQLYINKALELGEDPVVCGIAGAYYLWMKDYEKAEKMYQKKLKESVSLRHKAEALNGLGNVMKCQNNYDKASFFFNKEIDIMDSLAQQHQKENVKDIQYKADYKNVVINNTHKMSKMVYIFCILVGVLILIAVTFIVVYRKNNREIRSKKKELENYANEIAYLNKIKNDSNKEKKILIREMERKMDSYIKSVSHGHKLYEGVCLGKIVEKRDVRAMEDILTFYKVVDADFFNQMEHQYNNLTTQNLLILMLKHIGKSDDEISDLLCVSKGSLRSYMSRIKRCRI